MHGYEIQVGAYGSKAQAEHRLARVQSLMRDALGNAVPRTSAAVRGRKQVFRARFIGFDAAGAAATCNRMRRRAIDCYVARGT